jgi:hypothetical protein
MRNNVREGTSCTYLWKDGTKVLCVFENNYPVRGKIIYPNNTSKDFDKNNPNIGNNVRR